MQLPLGTDPDELLLAEGGPQRWNELREVALPLIDHVIGVVADKYDIKTARGKSDAVQELSQFIRELGDAIQRAHYIQRIASVLRTPEEAVQEAVTRARRGPGGRGQGSGVRDQGSGVSRDSSNPDRQSMAPAVAGLPAALDPATAAEE